MADRRRTRRGRNESVAGAPAEETLEDLVAQFSDRYAFARELIQNSLDAGSARVEIVMRFSDDLLRVAFVDDGEGMDRDTIEGYLLTLFRSTKEDDLTKIGKFGIGFVSLFALKPDQVVVTTGRDFVTHRVSFDETRAWTLEEVDEPFEGTSVELHLPRSKKQARVDCKKIVESAERWCRFARATIVHRAEGLGSWPERRIEGVFEVAAPVSVTIEQDGLRAVLGPSPKPEPQVLFASGGLTLWEGALDIVPGVEFMVEGRHLEHTLTRDNVRRDRHLDEVVRRLTAAASDRLRPAIEEALREAAHAGDIEKVERLLSHCRPDAVFRWSDDVPWVPAWPEPVTLGRVKRRLAKPLLSWFGTREHMLCSREGGALAERLAEDHLVLRTTPGGPVARWVAALTGATPQSIRSFLWSCTRSPTAAERALLDAAIAIEGRAMRVGRVLGRGGEGFAVRGEAGDQLSEVPSEAESVVIREDHELWPRLLELPVGVAAPLLVHSVRVSLEGPVSATPELALAAMTALEAS